MTTHPESAVQLAAEITASAITAGTISAPRKMLTNKDTALPLTADSSLETLASRAKKIRIRQIGSSGQTHIQAEFFIEQQTFHRNLSTKEMQNLLELCFSSHFSRGEFTGTKATLSVMISKRGTITLCSKETADTEQIIGGHDRLKQRLIPEGTPIPFLVNLGIMTAEGTVVRAKYAKYRQINRYLEFIQDILPQLEARAREKNGQPLRIVDFGCGKSYLTFALYHYLSTVKKIPVIITGLDLKQDVIEHCSLLARQYGYAGLSFSVGDIAHYTAELGGIDMVVSLHACDTATDYALAQAVQWNTPIIFAVPCCQHELNSQLDKNTTDRKQPNTKDLFEPLLRHGLMRERFAALLTDTLRAELLENAGYRVQLVEFIDMSHTPKNILIRAIREPSREESTNVKTPSQAYRALRDAFSITPTLETELFASAGADTPPRDS